MELRPPTTPSGTRFCKNDTEAKSLGFTGTPSILVEGPGGKKPFTTIPTVSQIQAAVKSVQ